MKSRNYNNDIVRSHNSSRWEELKCNVYREKPNSNRRSRVRDNEKAMENVAKTYEA